jgi:error-prone DNA polymerase
MEDLNRRIPLSRPVLEALSVAGAFGSLADGAGRTLDRRRALWAAGAVARTRPDTLPGTIVGLEAPTLPGLSPAEVAGSDLWATGIAPDGHPTKFIRDHLESMGVLTADELLSAEPGSRVVIGGVVTHRQRPATASGITFLNIEDETGLINVICSPGLWKRYRRVARSAPALLVRGRLERVEGVTNVIADKLERLPIATSSRSRDFR